MADAERTDELGSLFVSVTGSDSVVESQAEESAERELRAAEPAEGEDGDGITDSTSFHGLDDAIDDPEPTGEARS